MCLQWPLAPSAAPLNLAADLNATSHDSFYLSWDPLPPEEQNGIILGYVINITDISSGDVQQLFADSNNLTVDSLSPYTTYVCIVAAYTSAGTGPVSAEMSVQTQESSEHMNVF